MYSTIYWLTRLDSILGFFTGLSIMSGVAAIILIIGGFVMSDSCYNEDDEQNNKEKFKWGKRLAAIGLTSAFISIFIPSKNDAILIFAGGKAYEYVKSDTSLQKIPYKTTEYLKLVLDNQIKEFKNKD